jgi:hypothetical protein
MSRRRRKPARNEHAPRAIEDALYPTLDLHGMTAAEATRAAREWIHQHRLAGESVVRLITGRGMHSVGPPVLPDAIEALLRDLSGGVVRSHERETGGGVHRVWLNRPDAVSRPASATRPVGRMPSDLVRLAEESLGELGIDPTPALVEAEVRRIIARGGEVAD